MKTLKHNGNSGPIREYFQGDSMPRIEIFKGPGVSSLILWVLEPQVASGATPEGIESRVFDFNTPSDEHFPGSIHVSFQKIGHEDMSGRRFFLEGFIARGKHRNAKFIGFYDFQRANGWIEYQE